MEDNMGREDSRPVNDRYPHQAELIVPPGATLQEALDNLAMSQAELALRTGLSKKTVNQIIGGHEPITYETAERLERVTGVPASLWNNLESTYRGRLARLKEKERLAQDRDWLQGIPVKQLVQRGVIEEQADEVGWVRALLTFFGVNSAGEWEALWASPEGAFRKSEVFNHDPKAVATWLRLGERVGRALVCPPYDKEKFKDSLTQIRALTVEPPEVFVPRMKGLCSAAGVAVVFVREIKGAPVSGAAYWLSSEKAIIQMTLRGRWEDRFWFTFFHEAGHILKHGKKEKFVDDDSQGDPQEEEANRFAEDSLIPPSRAKELPELKTRQRIVEFARSIGIAPGIVLGRLQKMDLLPHGTRDNDLKKRLRWVDEPSADGVEITFV
jgi:HTH-type transcriptional regulator / antitoxin HigA